MAIPKFISQRFAYQFGGKHIGLSVARGWVPLFEKLCLDIDTALGDDKREFEWSQIKEKFGSARFYFRMNHRQDDPIGDVIYDLVHRAESDTFTKCLMCGRLASGSSYGAYYAILCPEHAAASKNGRLPEIWDVENLPAGDQT